MTSHWEYRRWDGTQRGFEDEVDALFSELTDDLLYHGDPDAALRRLLTSGFDGADGERVQGLRELMERLRQQRQEELDRGELGGAFEDIARELEEVVSQERSGLESLRSEAAASDDERRRQVTDEVVAERSMELELLPNDLAGRVRGLQQYDFVSSDAREHFEELLDKLRQEITKSWFDQMSEAMTNPDPAQLERVRQMLDALNRMIEQRDRGEPLDPSFESFMQDYGEYFPGNPQTLDELLEQFAAQMAAVQAVLDSMSPDQRAQLQALAESVFEDLDMRWQIDRLADNLRRAVPDADGAGATSSRARTPWAWPTPPPRRGVWGRWTSSSSSCARPRHRGRWPRSTSTRWPSTSVRTAPARSTGWPSWRASSRRRGSSSSARVATS